jgi:mono/diheme cytochrome c family protein
MTPTAIGLHKPRAFLLAGVAAALVTVGLVAVSILAAPAQAQSGDPLLERGEYLVTAGPCAECHTVRVEGDPTQLDQTKLLAGGERFDLPFGTIYSANITPDNETGIGMWSVSDIVRALDEGLDKDGNPLVLMPWQNFRGMSSEDKVAIALYLKSVAPINNAVPASELAAPAGALHAAAAEDARAIGPGIAPDNLDSFARGEYLLWNLAACQDCHGKDLKGNVPPFFAPDITAETGAASAWTTEQIVTAIEEGARPDGSMIAPVMPWGDRAYGNFSDADVNAIATYLKTARPEQIAAAALPAPQGGDATVDPLVLAGAGLTLLLAGFSIARMRSVRRAQPG